MPRFKWKNLLHFLIFLIIFSCLNNLYQHFFIEIFVKNIRMSDATNKSYDVDELLSKMSLEDKVGQMTQVYLGTVQKQSMFNYVNEDLIDSGKLLNAIQKYRIGSIFGSDSALPANLWQKVITEIHDTTRKNTELKIPIIFGIDSIHGCTFIQEATLFPHPLNVASSFNRHLNQRIGEITALEMRAVGIPWNFNPVLDVGRQPLWPRLFETYGESEYVTAKMGQSYIKGQQGDNNLSKDTSVATCLKHFVGYSYPFNGYDRSPAYIPEYLLRETFLPPFEAGLKAGAITVMLNSALVNDIPGHANSYYINDILKTELKFDGLVVSDWEDIKRLYTRDNVASSPEEAVKIAIMAGVDMSMVPLDFSFYDICLKLAKEDKVFAERVNDATRRVLMVKKRLGLLQKNFDQIYPNRQNLEKIGSKKSDDFNLEVAHESIVLAKNENNVLPLKKTAKIKILVTGPTGNLLKVLGGGWSYTFQGTNERHFKSYGRKKLTVYEAIQKKLSHSNHVYYTQGSDFENDSDLKVTLEKAKSSDLIILCVGEPPYAELFGNIESLMLHEAQYKLANELFKIKKPVILIYLGGRPRIITELVNASSAVLLAFLPGNRGGEAIADILFGDCNPSAKLPITYPLGPNGFVPYDHKPLEKYESHLYPFGHGLSYSYFEYSNLRLSKDKISGQENDDSIVISVDIKNKGDMEGKESVLLFLNDEVASLSKSVKKLKGFAKVTLTPGQIVSISFTLTLKDLMFVNSKNKRVYEAGFFNVYIDKLDAKFELTSSSE